MADRDTQIITAATKLFLTQGVGVSTAKIARAAGVSNGTLFNAFPTKQALIDRIYLDAKTEMYAALPNFGTAPFTRAAVYENWCGYLDWARAHPATRRIMHLLLDAGLASAATRAAVVEIGADHAVWLQGALDAGLIRGPSLAYVGGLILYYLDLSISENLSDAEADLAFEMLCASIGLIE